MRAGPRAATPARSPAGRSRHLGQPRLRAPQSREPRQGHRVLPPGDRPVPGCRRPGRHGRDVGPHWRHVPRIGRARPGPHGMAERAGDPGVGGPPRHRGSTGQAHPGRGLLRRHAMSFRAGRRYTGMTSSLENKNVIIYGGAGGIGSAVARTFAREGARLFLVGRTRSTLDQVAKETGAEVAVLDALDEAAVTAHVADVVTKAGS